MGISLDGRPASPGGFLPALAEIHDAIDQGFPKAGIEIAFPQRDIHVRSIRNALSLVERQTETDSPQQT